MRAGSLLLVTLALTLPLAGCLGSAPNDPAPGDDDGSSTETATWNAYAFDEPVRAKGLDVGTLVGFSFTMEATEDGSTRVVDVDVTYPGAATEPVRTMKRSFDRDTGEMTDEVVSTDVHVHKVDHAITVQRDDTGTLQAGDSAEVEVWIPTDALEADRDHGWFLTRMSFQSDTASGLFELHLTPEMKAEMEQGGDTFYTPYVEGEQPSSWWGFGAFAGVYGLGMFQPWATGEMSLEPGNHTYEGMTYAVEPTTFRVGGHLFDGYRVTGGGDHDEGGNGSFSMTVSPDLPVPYAFHMRAHHQGGQLVQDFQLHDATFE